MKQFLIELDSDMPETPVYLGLCTDSDNQRGALFAAQEPGSSDVTIGWRDLQGIKGAINAGDGTRSGDPEWPFERAELMQAHIDFNKREFSKFIMSRDGTISCVRGGAIIAATLRQGCLPVAVCEVTGTSEAHVPSWGAYDAQGHFSVGRFNPSCRPC